LQSWRLSTSEKREGTANEQRKKKKKKMMMMKTKRYFADSLRPIRLWRNLLSSRNQQESEASEHNIAREGEGRILRESNHTQTRYFPSASEEKAARELCRRNRSDSRDGSGERSEAASVP
jgi:hypothetical protein